MLAMAQGVEYELVMPKRYADLSEDEMEYDGGWLNFLLGLVCSAISIVCTFIASTTDNQTIAQAATAIGAVATAVGMAMGTSAVINAAAAAWKVATPKLASVAYTAMVTPTELAFTGTASAVRWPF